MTGESERRHGFPLGADEIRPAATIELWLARLRERASSRLTWPTFYDSTSGVTGVDVGNGYFLDPASDVLLRFREHGAVDFGAYEKVDGAVIGSSNGGGLSYLAGS